MSQALYYLGRRSLLWQTGTYAAAIGVLWTILAACAPPEAFVESPDGRATPSADVRVAVVSLAPSPAPARATVPSLTPVDPREIDAGQHMSAGGSYSATETESAGPMICHIERNSAAFRQLVANSDAHLLWNDGGTSSYNDENHLMHPAAVKPLRTLADLAAAEWADKTQVMVTAAYDSEGKHDLAQPAQDRKYSLHFEGRSIDLIPWPPDLTKLARLCALAHRAGFDWVHNEQDHCHVSVKAQSLCQLYDYRAGS